MDIVESAVVTSEEANQRLPPPQPPPPSTTKSFTSHALSPKRKKNNNNSLSRTTSPTKLIEAAVKSANYSGKFLRNFVFVFLHDVGKIKIGAQSFTSLKADLCQDVNRGVAFSRWFYGTFS